MTTTDWVRAQWKEKKTDKNIRSELATRGWTVRQASCLLERTYREGIFSPGLSAGITLGLVLVMASSLLFQASNLVCSFLVLFAALYAAGTWFGYRLALRAFTIVTAVVVGYGVLLGTILLGFSLLHRVTDLIPSWTGILLFGVGFFCAVYAMDCAFHGVRVRLENAPPKNTKKVLAWSAAFGMVAMITIAILYVVLIWEMEDLLAQNARSSHTVVNDLRDQYAQAFSGINNQEFKRRIDEHYSTILSVGIPQRSSIRDVLTDRATRDLISTFPQIITGPNQAGLDVYLARGYEQYLAAGSPVPDDLATEFALWQKRHVAASSGWHVNPQFLCAGTQYSYDPEVLLLDLANIRPIENVLYTMCNTGERFEYVMGYGEYLHLNLENPEQADIAAFLIWNTERAEREAARGEVASMNG